MVRLHPNIKHMNIYLLGIDIGASGEKTGLPDLSILKLKYIAL